MQSPAERNFWQGFVFSGTLRAWQAKLSTFSRESVENFAEENRIRVKIPEKERYHV